MTSSFVSLSGIDAIHRKRKGIEPSKPLLAQSFIGFEDRAAHQLRMRFRRRRYSVSSWLPTDEQRSPDCLGDDAVPNLLRAGARPAGLAKLGVVGSESALRTERLGQDLERVGYGLVLLCGEAVVDPGSLPSAVDDARCLEDAELTRRGRLVELERRLDVTHAQLAVREQGNDAETSLVAQRAEQSCQRPDFEVGGAGQH